MTTSCRNFLCPMGLTYLLCLCKILDTDKIQIGINFVIILSCPKTPHENGEHLQISRNCRYCLCNSSLKHYYDGLAALISPPKSSCSTANSLFIFLFLMSPYKRRVYTSGVIEKGFQDPRSS